MSAPPEKKEEEHPAAAPHGAYVPPHKRGGVTPPVKMPSQPPKQQQQRQRSAGRPKQQGARQGRSPASSPTRNNNNNNRNNKGGGQHHGPHHHGSNSGGGSHHGNNRNDKGGHGNHNQQQHHSKSHSPNNHHNNRNQQHSPTRKHHSPTRKEDLLIQKQQLQVLLDALDRICCINLDRRDDRWKSFQQHLHQSLGKKMGHSLWQRVERTSAVDGIPEDFCGTVVEATWDASINAKWDRHIQPPMLKEMTPGEVGCALSHIKLWRELAVTPPVVATTEGTAGDDGVAAPVAQPERLPTMMILEDDALFYSPKLAMNKAAIGNTQGNHNHNNNNNNQQQQQHEDHFMSIANHDFLTAFQMAWTQLPEDWDIWYLGFSDRGDRKSVDNDFILPKPKPHHKDHEHHHHHYPSMSIEIFQPTYGFHTHGYVLSSKAAQKLLDNLPVKGPLDVWLADNDWFGLKVYCSVVAGEGWHGTGAWLITQNRKKTLKDSDVHQSGRTDAAATESS